MTQIVKSEVSPEYVAGQAVVPAQVDAAMSVEAAIARHNLLIKYVETMLVKDVDYGTIPGVDKPFLLKPGAEKLAAFFGLHLWGECIDRREDWDKGFFAYTFKFSAMRGTQVAATGEGACNSMESKYRWRTVWDWKATDADKENAARVEERKDKNGKTHTVYIIENKDTWSLQNTILKMAQKRAAVGCVQIATSSSEFFAHDYDYIEGEYEEPPENGANKAPSQAEQIVTRLRERAAGNTTKPREITPSAQGLLKGKIAEAMQDKGDKARHLLLRRIWGKEHVAELSYAEFNATANWLVAGKDPKTGDWPLKPEGIAEALTVFRDAQMQVGQMEIADLFGEDGKP